MSVTGNATRRSIAEVRGRRKRFGAALSLAGKTQAHFAADNDVTPGHVSQVLSGKRESASLIEKVDAFIAKHLGDQAA